MPDKRETEEGMPMTASSEAPAAVACTFCLKPTADVEKMIAGPGDHLLHVCRRLQAEGAGDRGRRLAGCRHRHSLLRLTLVRHLLTDGVRSYLTPSGSP